MKLRPASRSSWHSRAHRNLASIEATERQAAFSWSSSSQGTSVDENDSLG